MSTISKKLVPKNCVGSPLQQFFRKQYILNTTKSRNLCTHQEVVTLCAPLKALYPLPIQEVSLVHTDGFYCLEKEQIKSCYLKDKVEVTTKVVSFEIKNGK